MVRTSLKRMKAISDTYAQEEEAKKEDEKYMSPEKIEEKKPEPVVPPKKQKTGKAYLANMGKFKLLDSDLKARLEAIGNLASEFELYLALVQHEANEFGGDGKSDEKVDEHVIKTEVIEVVANISQN